MVEVCSCSRMGLKPVVTSDIKGVDDLLRHSNAGIAVTEDPVELANAIIKLLKDEN